MAIKRRKLYFDAVFTWTGVGGVEKTTFFPCTQFTAGTVSKERYAGFLDALMPLTKGSPPEKKRQNATGAWFQVTGSDGLGDTVLGLPRVTFVGETATTTPLANLANATFKGQDTVYTRNFGIRVGIDSLITVGLAGTVRGVLYVQRQHSIEV